ncbi:MAG: hypothetical protein H6832_13115 [Planctomycetes bacterium]|nr:hypothetical protein [Planctomycetota bacterium]
MLFSDKNLAAYMSENFECAWQELRPVPQASIDFGNGRVLKRTLSGNVATWICMPTTSSASTSGASDPANRVIDVIPALFTIEHYQARLAAAHELHGKVCDLDDATTVLADWHRQRAGQIRNKPLLGPAGDPHRKKQATIALRTHGIPFLAKTMVESSVKRSFLVEDDAYNHAVRSPQAHALLAVPREPEAPNEVASLTPKLFKTVLGVDLDDPYLGLAPYVLGGEIGRH